MPERPPGHVPEHGPGSSGELPRHREARLEWRTRVTDAVATLREYLDTQMTNDPETNTQLKTLAADLDLYRPAIERADPEPFTLDHSDA